TNTCASHCDARSPDNSLSVDNRPFDTLGPDGLFPWAPKPKGNLAAELEARQRAWFDEWWAEYWLHKSKKAAYAAFRKCVKTEKRFQQIMTATRAQKSEMLEREPRHRPYATTWLRQERWNDEIEPTPTPTKRTHDEWPEFPQGEFPQ